MKKLIILLSLISFGCSKVVYLSPQGTVIGINDEYITVAFDCENVKRPDCEGIAKFSRKEFQNVHLFQTIQLR